MWYGGLIASMVTMVMCMGLMACSSKQPVSAPPEPVQDTASSKCKGIFVLAPEEYMLYFHGNDPVILASEGEEVDLPVYCTPEEATRAEAEMKARHELADGVWTLYTLRGVWEKDVIEVAPSQWRMRHPAELSPYSQTTVTAEYPVSQVNAATHLQSSAAY